MHKIKIQFIKQTTMPGYWRLILPTKMFYDFSTREEMIKALDELTKDFKRLEKALHIIFYLRENELSDKELSMIRRVQREMICSKKQYGWLKGIQERQYAGA